MASLFDLLKQYGKLDKQELLRIAKNAYRTFDQSSNRNGNRDFVAHMIGYVAYNADIKITQQEYKFFQVVTGYTYNSFEEFKRTFRNHQMLEPSERLFQFMRQHFSMQSKVALLQICLCLCVIDGISSFERGYLQSLFGYDVTEAYDSYAQM